MYYIHRLDADGRESLLRVNKSTEMTELVKMIEGARAKATLVSREQLPLIQHRISGMNDCTWKYTPLYGVECEAWEAM